MTSHQKMPQFYNVDILNDIIGLPKTSKNKKENSDDNFWDIVKDNDNTENNLNLSGNKKNNYKIDNNTKKINNKENKKEKENEKERIEVPYNNQSKKNEKINNLHYTKKNKRMQQNENKKKNRPKSVDINIDKPKKKIETVKIDELSVFKRNQKWLKTRQDNLNKAIEKIVNKKEKEIIEFRKPQNIKKSSELERYQIYNEENNVKYKLENLNFFLRLSKGREEKGKTLSNMPLQKINILKYSHYSGLQESNISKREMNKCIKYIHDKLKGKK